MFLSDDSVIIARSDVVLEAVGEVFPIYASTTEGDSDTSEGKYKVPGWDVGVVRHDH